MPTGVDWLKKKKETSGSAHTLLRSSSELAQYFLPNTSGRALSVILFIPPWHQWFSFAQAVDCVFALDRQPLYVTESLLLYHVFIFSYNKYLSPSLVAGTQRPCLVHASQSSGTWGPVHSSSTMVHISQSSDTWEPVHSSRRYIAASIHPWPRMSFTPVTYNKGYGRWI